MSRLNVSLNAPRGSRPAAPAAAAAVAADARAQQLRGVGLQGAGFHGARRDLRVVAKGGHEEDDAKLQALQLGPVVLGDVKKAVLLRVRSTARL